MDNTLLEIFEIELGLSDRLAKAKALCSEILTQYCEYAVVDPDSSNEQERDNARDLCGQYPVWSMLLYCAFDMLTEAKKLDEKLEMLLFGRKTRCEK